MATYTTNLGLKKPAQSDKVRIADFNNNADTIDAAIGAVGGKNLVGMVNALQDAVAIIANGDTHVAISSGDFVYVKNNTHGLSDGLYVASANVSANGTISDSNMTADAKGGLNALNSKLDTALDVFGNLKFATLANFTTSTSKNYSVSNNSRHIVFVVSVGSNYRAVLMVVCSSGGVVSCAEIYKGSGISYSVGTNTITIGGTHSSDSTSITAYDLVLAGSVMS